ncbi:hypothetical protein [Patulibacter minatonensis]|uniref:hypothetical protein n=1 Tax=Patulibacter minatonensis TaxID=298163 RepID=UPI00047BD06B|nr:hypothetical protein [Patulibacter minatonensis]
MSSTKHRLTAAVFATSCVGLATASSASADAIRYSVAPNPSLYTVKDNGNGLIKVSYLGCVTASQAQTLQFTFGSDVSKPAHATFKLLQLKGTSPTPVFSPPEVDLVPGDTQDHTATIAYDFRTATQAATSFRVKLEPDNGSGLGQAAGVVVDVPCILAAPASPATPPAPGTPATPGAPAAPGTPVVPAGTPTVPTTGFIPAPTGRLTRGGARCISTPRTLRLRARETTIVRVTIRSTSGQELNRALVRATYPGGVQNRRTDVAGVATFRVKAARAGTLVLQSEVCFGADRRRVLAPRVVRAPRAGRFTG